MKSPRPVIGVVGLGAMGFGIAQVFVQAGFQVLATDAHAGTRDAAVARMDQALTAREAAGKFSALDKASAIQRLVIVSGPDAMAPAKLVIEAIAESLEAKRHLFSSLESVVSSDTVFATNTSSLSVHEIAQGLHHPERVLGMHFFNPAPAMRLVELVGHRGGDPISLDLARTVAEAAGKTVVSCPDSPGFIVNRCARPYYGEALALLEEGRTTSEIDAAMLTTGYRIGPFSLIDLIGADINLAATEGLYAAMHSHPRYHVFDALRTQVAKGDLGRKSGRGFLFPEADGAPPQDADAIVQRIESALVNEAASLLADGGVTMAGIDTAMKLGLNFPRGPFEILQARGPKQICATLDELEARAPRYLRGRYLPLPILSEAA